MNDRELLEAAAKSVGYTVNARRQAERDELVDPATASLWINLVSTGWNPLTDDGHALRLAVKLGFINPGQWPCAGYQEANRMLRETGSVDWYAATRRAIVRAAAAIGGAK